MIIAIIELTQQYLRHIYPDPRGFSRSGSLSLTRRKLSRKTSGIRICQLLLFFSLYRLILRQKSKDSLLLGNAGHLQIHNHPLQVRNQYRSFGVGVNASENDKGSRWIRGRENSSIFYLRAILCLVYALTVSDALKMRNDNVKQ